MYKAKTGKFKIDHWTPKFCGRLRVQGPNWSAKGRCWIETFAKKFFFWPLWMKSRFSSPKMLTKSTKKQKKIPGKSKLIIWPPNFADDFGYKVPTGPQKVGVGSKHLQKNFFWAHYWWNHSFSSLFSKSHQKQKKIPGKSKLIIWPPNFADDSWYKVPTGPQKVRVASKILQIFFFWPTINEITLFFIQQNVNKKSPKAKKKFLAIQNW